MSCHLPWFVDPHVHFREPGGTHKGDMESESRAAMAGCIRTVCDMPNTNPPTTTIEALRDKVERSQRVKELCDLHFFFGATSHEHLNELRNLWTQPQHKELRKRCCGLKLYLEQSTGHQRASRDVLEAAFNLCGELGIVLVAHCEHAPTVAKYSTIPFTTPDTHSTRRPPSSEECSIAEVCELARRHRARTHIAHLSTAEGLALIRKAKQEGLNITSEVTPHHLFLSTHDYNYLGHYGKVNPPLRPDNHRPALWEGLLDGSIDCLATDHAPHLRHEKESEDPPSGMPGVEVSIRLLVSVLSGHWPHPSEPAPTDVMRRVAAMDNRCEFLRHVAFDNANRIFSLHATSNPSVSVSFDASITSEIKGNHLQSRCGWTPYEGWVTAGEIKPLL